MVCKNARWVSFALSMSFAPCLQWEWSIVLQKIGSLSLQLCWIKQIFLPSYLDEGCLVRSPVKHCQETFCKSMMCYSSLKLIWMERGSLPLHTYQKEKIKCQENLFSNSQKSKTNENGQNWIYVEDYISSTSYSEKLIFWRFL